MISNLLFLLIELFLTGYFFYRWKAKEKNKGFSGFATGAFLIISLVHAKPLIATLIKKVFF
jgi:hypothetical protein